MKAQGLISGLKPYGIVENQHLKLKIKNQVKGSSWKLKVHLKKLILMNKLMSQTQG